MLLPGAISVYNMILARTFIQAIPDDLWEAAEIDGAGDYTIFFQIVIPQAMGLITALFLTSWIGGWNGYEGFLIYMPGLPNLAAGLYLFQVHVERTAQWEYVYGACFIIAIPPSVSAMSTHLWWQTSKRACCQVVFL